MIIGPQAAFCLYDVTGIALCLHRSLQGMNRIWIFRIINEILNRIFTHVI